MLAGERNIVLDSVLVEDEHLWIRASDLPDINGFDLKPEGLCAGELCIPVRAGSAWTKTHAAETFVDATAFAAHVGQPGTLS